MIYTAQTLAAVMKLTDDYTATMQKIIKSADEYNAKQKAAQAATNQFKSSLSGIKPSADNGATGINSLLLKMGKIASAAYLGKKAIEVMFDALKTGAKQQVQLNTFQSLVGNAQAGTSLYNYVSAYAKKSALGREDLANATTSWLAFTRDSNQIEQLNKLVERLYAKNPEQGANGAVFALKEILTGQTQSIKDRFNMNGISADKITQLTQKGDIAGTIKYLDKEFNRFGATQDVVNKNFTSLLTQTNIFTSNLKTSLGDEATPAVQNLSLFMQQLNADMQAGKFKPFFDVVSKGLTAIAGGLSWAAQNATWLAPVVAGVATALIFYNAATAIAIPLTALLGATAQAAIGNFIGAAAIIAGVGAAAVTLGVNLNTNSQSTDASKSADDYKKQYEANLKDSKISTTIPTEVTNKSPIKVKGEVEIEKESMKYMFDLAGMKFFAKYSQATLAPAVNMYGTTVKETLDLDKVTNHLTNSLAEMTAVQPKGVY